MFSFLELSMLLPDNCHYVFVTNESNSHDLWRMDREHSSPTTSNGIWRQTGKITRLVFHLFDLFFDFGRFVFRFLFTSSISRSSNQRMQTFLNNATLACFFVQHSASVVQRLDGGNKGLFRLITWEMSLEVQIVIALKMN